MSTAAPRDAGLIGGVQALWTDLRGAFSERVELFSFELGHALRAAVQILALVVAAAVVGVTAWLAAWAVVAGLLVALGLHWLLALLGVVLINLAAVAWAVARARRLLPRLSLPATRRHLTVASTTVPPTGPPATSARPEPPPDDETPHERPPSGP